MGILDIIAQGGRGQGKSLGDISMEKQKMGLSVEDLKVRQGALSLERKKTAASLQDKILAREKLNRELQKDRLRQDIIQGGYSNARQLGAPEIAPELIMESALAAGYLELYKDVKDAYAGGKTTKPVSKIGKLYEDLTAAQEAGNKTEVQDLQNQIRKEESLATTAAVTAEEKSDEQAWEDLKNIFDFEEEFWGNESKEPEGYFAMQERYKELLRTRSKKEAMDQIQLEFEIDAQFGQDVVVPLAASNEAIDFDFTVED